MKKLIKAAYVLGFLFWGSFLIYSLVVMAAFNGFGNYYFFVCREATTFKVTKEVSSNCKIIYTYEVNGKQYSNDERITDELFKQKIGSASKLAICYNETYPSLSHINGVNLAVSREKMGIIISLFFLIFISLTYFFAKKDYWIEKYKIFLAKLSI
jgi:hypothetical protein